MNSLNHDVHTQPLRPSLFDLLSATQLSALLPPTLHQLLTVLTQRYPRYLLRAYNSYDEIYALLALLVEGQFLHSYEATFVEHFYGLRRERVVTARLPRVEADDDAGGAAVTLRRLRELRRGDVWRNLLVEVGGGYLSRKMNAACEREREREAVGLRERETEGLNGNKWKRRVKSWFRWFVRRGWPVVSALNGALGLVWCLAYLGGRTDGNSFWLWLVGTRIRRMGPADYRAAVAAEELRVKSARGRRHLLGVTSILDPRLWGDRVLEGLRLVLPASIFLLKFVEWWYASDVAKHLAKSATEVMDLPPPDVAGEHTTEEREMKGEEAEERKTKEEEIAEKRVEVPPRHPPPLARSSGLPIYVVPRPADRRCCPICNGDIITPTACQTGFVYCYVCIHRWLEGTHSQQEATPSGWESGQGRCAITGRRVLGGTSGLRRIIL